MAFGCCGKTFNCLFIFFNVIFSIVGLATIAFGVFLKVYPNANQLMSLVELHTDTNYLTNGAWIIVGFGALVFLVAFCGCVGAASGNKCLLGMYVILAIVIVIGEIGAFVVTILFVVRSQDVDAFQRDITKSFKDEYNKEQSKFKRPWDHVQTWFECCAINDYKDYENIYTEPDQKVPATCCKLQGDKDPDSPKPVNSTACQNEAKMEINPTMYLHRRGCFTLLRDTVKQYSTVLLIIQAVVIVITIIGVVIAACLCRRRKDEK